MVSRCRNSTAGHNRQKRGVWMSRFDSTTFMTGLFVGAMAGAVGGLCWRQRKARAWALFAAVSASHIRESRKSTTPSISRSRPATRRPGRRRRRPSRFRSDPRMSDDIRRSPSHPTPSVAADKPRPPFPPQPQERSGGLEGVCARPTLQGQQRDALVLREEIARLGRPRADSRRRARGASSASGPCSRRSPPSGASTSS